MNYREFWTETFLQVIKNSVVQNQPGYQQGIVPNAAQLADIALEEYKRRAEKMMIDDIKMNQAGQAIADEMNKEAIDKAISNVVNEINKSIPDCKDPNCLLHGKNHKH
jgi:hypothetical protein